jgi:serine/threonine protein kinase
VPGIPSPTRPGKAIVHPDVPEPTGARRPGSRAEVSRTPEAGYAPRGLASALPQTFGPYVLLKSLGQGAMGDVCLARPSSARRGIPSPVVVKRLHAELATNPDFVKRFQHEAEIAVSVDSPSVAKVYDVGKVGETLYLTMEFLSGWPASRFMEAIINSGRHASIASVIDLVEGGLRGLGALHSARHVKTGQPLGIVHRDVSPKNLMIGEDGEMRVIDLGLGKSTVQDWKTRTGLVMGSIGYMAPEQVVAEPLDRRTDLYAMGVVLYELLTLRYFIARAPIPTMLRASLNPTFIAPSTKRPDVPAGLDEVVARALAPKIADRFDTAEDFLAALRRVVPARSERAVMPLIHDLFGASLTERKAEIDGLLAAPLPDDLEPEQDRTVVFVERPGVRPLSEEDLSPTKVATRVLSNRDAGAQRAVAERTAVVGRRAAWVEPIVERGPARGVVDPLERSADLRAFDARPVDLRVAAGAEPRPFTEPGVYAPVSTSLIGSGRGGVPLGVTITLVAIAAILAATGTWLFARAPSDVVEVTPSDVTTLAPEDTALGAIAGPVEATPPQPTTSTATQVAHGGAPPPTSAAPVPTHAPVPRVERPVPERVAPERAAAPERTAAPAPERQAPPSSAESLEVSRGAIDALSGEIDVLADRALARHPDRDGEISRLQRAAVLAAKKSDLGAAVLELREIKAQLAGIAGG